jgi:hypothetical protein
MPRNPQVERELAQIRADPRYGIDGADADLVQRELDLLIVQAFEFEEERALLRRKHKRRVEPDRTPALPAASIPALPARPSRVTR